MLFNSTVWAPLWASVNILMFNIMTRYKEELSWTLCSVWVSECGFWTHQTTFVLSDAVYSENIGSLELTFQFISALQNHTEDRFSIQIWLKYRHEKTLKKTFSRRRPGSYFQSIYFSLSLSCLTDISTYPFFVPSDPEWTAENRENIFYSNGAETSQIKNTRNIIIPSLVLQWLFLYNST